MLVFFKSLLLGIIQGITEFFPISSSAHLKLFKLFFNLDISSFYQFDLFCHLGTTFASIFFLKKEIKNIFLNKDKNYILLILLAIVPLFFIYFFTKPIRDFLADIRFLPFFLILTALLLFIASKKNNLENKNLSKNKIKDVLLIGFGQAMALIPGLSRSGWTISFAVFRGWKFQEAIKFSYLLAIPTILGGSFLESIKAIDKISLNINLIVCYLAGFISSFVVGFFTIKYIFSITSNKKLRPFAIYLLTLGFLGFIYIYLIR